MSHERVKGIPSSFVFSCMKLAGESGSGEAKLWVGPMSREKEFDDFFAFGTGVKYRFNKKNLLSYLDQVKIEYAFQAFNQYKDVSLAKWEENRLAVLNLSDSDLEAPLQVFKDKGRYYIRSDAGVFTLFRKLAVPKMTDVLFEKDAASNTIEILLELNLDFSFDVKNARIGTVEEEPSYCDECLPRNLIYFGAPGTGKSYQLNKEAEKNFPGKSTRVTFHPDYSYAQFVGCFRPFSDVNDEGKHEIGYRYEAGPFLKVYAAAKLHPNEKYLLIIEEINRANTAAVFGDVFQLLDRKKNGASQYSVEVPDDMKLALIRLQSEMSSKEEAPLEAPEGYLEALEIPPNMYIWATMNSADQGVFPMDSAFKRRWDFRYIGIDDYEGEMQSVAVTLGDGRKINWNELRKAINKLLVDNNVNEDKLLGPFFIDAEECEKQGIFVDAFEDKVLLYLYEDAAKTKRRDVFKEGSVTYSVIRDDFEVNGERVFQGVSCSTLEEDASESILFSEQ